jgi:hypothetical protein
MVGWLYDEGINIVRTTRSKLLAAGFVILIFGAAILLRSEPETPFDSTAWKGAELSSEIQRQNSVRSHMVDDLLRHHNLVGLTRSQIEELLGKPDRIECSDYDCNYYLGPQRGPLKLHAECLGIRFEKDQVAKAGTWME